MLNKISQTEKDKYHMISMWNLRNKKNELIENRLTNIEVNLVMTRVERGWGAARKG